MFNSDVTSSISGVVIQHSKCTHDYKYKWSFAEVKHVDKREINGNQWEDCIVCDQEKYAQVFQNEKKSFKRHITSMAMHV